MTSKHSFNDIRISVALLQSAIKCNFYWSKHEACGYWGFPNTCSYNTKKFMFVLKVIAYISNAIKRYFVVFLLSPQSNICLHTLIQTLTLIYQIFSELTMLRWCFLLTRQIFQHLSLLINFSVFVVVENLRKPFPPPRQVLMLLFSVCYSRIYHFVQWKQRVRISCFL